MKYIVCVAIGAVAAVSMSPVNAQVEEKLKPAYENFQAADADKSGGLDAGEFKTFIDANAAVSFGKAKEIQKRNAYDRAFGKVDKDKSGSVTWAEFESMH